MMEASNCFLVGLGPIPRLMVAARKKPARVGPMAPKGGKMESKSSFFGAQKVTFSGVGGIS